jgi:hypothetical protein
MNPRDLVRVKLSSVPTDVLESVRSKWSVNHWGDSLWSRCAMCNFMNTGLIKIFPRLVQCWFCPLGENSWCTGRSRSSRIHIHHTCDETLWKKDVEKFREMLQAELDRRNKEGNLS